VYRTRVDMTFVVDGGPGTVICPAGTVMEPVPEGALTHREVVEFHRMIRVEALRAPNTRLVAVRWRGLMRVLAIGHALVPARRTIACVVQPDR
jgi:hypothetical protein